MKELLLNFIKDPYLLLLIRGSIMLTSMTSLSYISDKTKDDDLSDICIIGAFLISIFFMIMIFRKG